VLQVFPLHTKRSCFIVKKRHVINEYLRRDHILEGGGMMPPQYDSLLAKVKAGVQLAQKCQTF